MDQGFCRRLHDILTTLRARQAAFLAELIKMPSDNPPGDCARHAARAAALLEELGLAVESYPVPEALVRGNGMVSATNLIIRQHFGDGPTVALNAHGDVVPPGRGWTRDPYGAEIRDGVMYGRGVAVSKSDFATYAFALMALRASGASLKGTVELHFTYDEEAGGHIGPKWLLDEGISKPNYAIAAGFSYGVVIAHNGCLHLEVEVNGKAAHAALPHTGHDALEATVGILSALYEHRKSLGLKRSKIDGLESPTLVVGLIKGGINTNVVPDRVTFRIDRRLIPEESLETVEGEVRALIESASREFFGITVEVRRILAAQPFVPVPGQKKLVEPLVAHGSRIMGERVRPYGVPLYTDARHYSARGIPTVLYGAGPRTLLEAGAHAADERLRLDDLSKATEVVASVLLDLLGGA